MVFRFQKATQNLLDAVQKNLWFTCAQNHEQDIKAFYDMALEQISYSSHGRAPRNSQPGHEEWCEFLAIINVDFGFYFRRQNPRYAKLFKNYPPAPAPSATEALGLLEEVLDIRPRQGRERWLKDIEEDSRFGTRNCTTRSEAEEILKSLLETGRKDYRDAYKEIYTRIVNEFTE